MGANSGSIGQSSQSIAIGYGAGQTNQQPNAIALGYSAGALNQGTNSIAIGYNAGSAAQPANSIVLSASNPGITAIGSGLFVNPIRQSSNGGAAGSLWYNPATKEICYN